MKSSTTLLTEAGTEIINTMKSNGRLKGQLLDSMQLKGNVCIPLKVNVLFEFTLVKAGKILLFSYTIGEHGKMAGSHNVTVKTFLVNLVYNQVV